jgi:hypothetical protein
MSEEEPMMLNVPTSPDLPTGDDNITSAKKFSGAMTLDLTDAEIQAAMRIVNRVKQKYQEVFRRKFNDPSTFTLDDVHKWVDQFEDEIKYELADKVNVLASVDTVPLLEGKPLSIEWLGVLPGGNLERYGMDHERKGWEVKRANQRGENYLGEKDQ